MASTHVWSRRSFGQVQLPKSIAPHLPDDCWLDDVSNDSVNCLAAFRPSASYFHLLRQIKVTKAKAPPESAPGAMLPVPCVAQSGWALAKLAALKQTQAPIQPCATRRSQTGNQRQIHTWHCCARPWSCGAMPQFYVIPALSRGLVECHKMPDQVRHNRPG